MGNETSRGNGGTMKGIVIVRDGTAIKPKDPNEDPDIKRLKDIPRFFPILRSAIGRRDVVDHRDISPRPFLQLSLRLSNHFSLCAKSVNAKQNKLSVEIKAVDTRVTECLNEIAERKRRLDRLKEALAKVDKIHAEMDKMNDMVEAVKASLDDLALMVPSDVTFPPFIFVAADPMARSIASSSSTPSTSHSSPCHTSSSSSSTPSHQTSTRRMPPIDEVRVVDKTPTQSMR